MPVVHSCRVHLATVSGKSCPRRDWASATLYTLAESSQFWCATRYDSQVRHETLWIVHHRLLKEWDLNEVRHERRGYTRGSKARRVFPSTFSFLPCLGFSRRECTAGITLGLHIAIKFFTNLSFFYYFIQIPQNFFKMFLIISQNLHKASKMKNFPIFLKIFS